MNTKGILAILYKQIHDNMFISIPKTREHFVIIILWVMFINSAYYMISSVSGQDEPNLAMWLATWAGKIELSCPFRILTLSDK